MHANPSISKLGNNRDYSVFIVALDYPLHLFHQVSMGHSLRLSWVYACSPVWSRSLVTTPILSANLSLSLEFMLPERNDQLL